MAIVWIFSRLISSFSIRDLGSEIISAANGPKSKSLPHGDSIDHAYLEMTRPKTSRDINDNGKCCLDALWCHLMRCIVEKQPVCHPLKCWSYCSAPGLWISSSDIRSSWPSWRSQVFLWIINFPLSSKYTTKSSAPQIGSRETVNFTIRYHRAELYRSCLDILDSISWTNWSIRSVHPSSTPIPQSSNRNDNADALWVADIFGHFYFLHFGVNLCMQ